MISATRHLLIALIFAGGFLPLAVAADDVQPRQQIRIAFVDIDGDPRYQPIRGYERIVLKTRAHPFTGAEIGIDDAAIFSRMLPIDFVLDRITVKSSADIAPAVSAALAAGTHFFLIDAPTEAFKPARRGGARPKCAPLQCLGAG